jgi:hypothetical protein
VRKLAWALALIVAMSALSYSAVSLARWEWTRALYFGLVFLAAEVAVATALVLRRLGSGTGDNVAHDPEVLARIRASPPARRRASTGWTRCRDR